MAASQPGRRGRRGRSTQPNVRLLRIYLGDHLAGATGGLELARRCLGSNRRSELGRFLDERLIPEIVEDRQALLDVMERLGIAEQPWRTAAGWVAEKVGRLKLNGYVVGYSPLSRLVELEGLAAGVQAKRSLWQGLGEIAPGVAALDGVDFVSLIGRAQGQLDGLEEHRRAAARVAFVETE
ncbi:MAG: hypothetical protein ABR518_00205 [Actinomycetota bacterium]